VVLVNLRRMLETIRAYRAGAPLGDVVVMKLDALSTPPAETLRKLAALHGYAPDQNLAALRALPAGTLGREYARFLDANGIEPLVVSPALKERFRTNPWALRYTATHDLHHLLTGFDTGLAGESGVVAFNVGQGAAPIGRGMLRFIRGFYSAIAPAQAPAIRHNVDLGLELGRRAELVIAQPIEDLFGEPLAQVRNELRIPDPARSGVMASRPSRVADLIYGRSKPAA
jgi:ubiquinone biosynthesis protein COQ4